MHSMLLVNSPGGSEVNNLDEVALWGDEVNVLWLQVSVHNIVLVQISCGRE